MDNNIEILKSSAIEFNDYPDDQSVLDLVGDKKYVFIGESTHGTHEFYKIRAEITKKLITEKGFKLIAIEGDWPDTYEINKYVRGSKNIKTAKDALSGFKRFPTWMWRNKVVMEFIEWLRIYNSKLEDKDKVGFYGLDLYSMNASIEAVIKYLDIEDPEAAIRARKRYSCFDHFKDELQEYGYRAALGITRSCERIVIEQLIELTHNSYKYMKENGLKEDEFFYIEQNAILIKNAEKYYRSMFNRSPVSWNIRDRHMFETFDNLTKYFTHKTGDSPKIITWAHNSHIGDARATDSSIQGQINIGQLAKEKYGKEALLIGFLTNSGTVTAASNWDGITERKKVRNGIARSYENLFHKIGVPKFLLIFRGNNILKEIIPDNLLERAIGVIYRPDTELQSHYFNASITRQFDALIYVDVTSALEPLETNALWHKGEVYETFPSGL